MVHVDARDWACECCVGGDDDGQQYRRFRGSRSALPVYINHLSGHAPLSSYFQKVSIFYYQKFSTVSNHVDLETNSSLLFQKRAESVTHVFPCQTFETFFTTEKNKRWQCPMFSGPLSLFKDTVIQNPARSQLCVWPCFSRASDNIFQHHLRLTNVDFDLRYPKNEFWSDMSRL